MALRRKCSKNERTKKRFVAVRGEVRMTSYVINKRHRDMEVFSIPSMEGYTFKPKALSEDFIHVNKVNVVNHEMIDKILTRKFEKSFKRLVALSMRVLEEEEADEGDTTIVLGEVELVREILLNRYQKFIDKEKEELFLKKLRLIENELRMKQIKVKKKAEYLTLQEQKSKGIGR